MIVVGSLSALSRGKIERRILNTAERICAPWEFQIISRSTERPMFTRRNIIVSRTMPTLPFLVDNQVLFTSPIARFYLSSQIVLRLLRKYNI